MRDPQSPLFLKFSTAGCCLKLYLEQIQELWMVSCSIFSQMKRGWQMRSSKVHSGNGFVYKWRAVGVCLGLLSRIQTETLLKYYTLFLTVLCEWESIIRTCVNNDLTFLLKRQRPDLLHMRNQRVVSLNIQCFLQGPFVRLLLLYLFNEVKEILLYKLMWRCKVGTCLYFLPQRVKQI